MNDFSFLGLSKYMKSSPYFFNYGKEWDVSVQAWNDDVGYIMIKSCRYFSIEKIHFGGFVYVIATGEIKLAHVTWGLQLEFEHHPVTNCKFAEVSAATNFSKVITIGSYAAYNNIYEYDNLVYPYYPSIIYNYKFALQAVQAGSNFRLKFTIQGHYWY